MPARYDCNIEYFNHIQSLTMRIGPLAIYSIRPGLTWPKGLFLAIKLKVHIALNQSIPNISQNISGNCYTIFLKYIYDITISSNNIKIFIYTEEKSI